MLPTDDEKYRAPALDKGLDILELLASADGGLTQVEIANHLGRTTSEIFRMLVVLRRRDYVELGNNDRYQLTTRMFEVAHRYPPVRRLTAIAGEVMQRLAHQINQSVHICILQAGRLLVVAQADCSDNNLNKVRLGAQIPIYDSASGRVLAALMGKEALENLLKMAGEDSAARREKFLADLPQIRKLGYCEGSSLTIKGVTNLSAPVFDYTGSAIAAMTTPFIHRLTGQDNASVPQARDALIAACQELSRRMGSDPSAS